MYITLLTELEAAAGLHGIGRDLPWAVLSLQGKTLLKQIWGSNRFEDSLKAAVSFKYQQKVQSVGVPAEKPEDGAVCLVL